jgi:hypothetical protein
MSPLLTRQDQIGSMEARAVYHSICTDASSKLVVPQIIQ